MKTFNTIGLSAEDRGMTPDFKIIEEVVLIRTMSGLRRLNIGPSEVYLDIDG